MTSVVNSSSGPSAHPPAPETVLCPGCGYNLRGLPVHTRCPECGKEVHIPTTLARANQWVDVLLLDLWSILLLQLVGIAGGSLGAFAIYLGQTVALLLILATALYFVVASLWLGGLLIVLRMPERRSMLRMMPAPRRRRVWRFVWINLVLLAAMIAACACML